MSLDPGAVDRAKKIANADWTNVDLQELVVRSCVPNAFE